MLSNLAQVSGAASRSKRALNANVPTVIRTSAMIADCRPDARDQYQKAGRRRNPAPAAAQRRCLRADVGDRHAGEPASTPLWSLACVRAALSDARRPVRRCLAYMERPGETDGATGIRTPAPSPEVPLHGGL